MIRRAQTIWWTEQVQKSQDLANQNAQVWDILPDPTTLAKDPDFLAGKQVEFGGLEVSQNMAFPAFSTLSGAGNRRLLEDDSRVYNGDSSNNNAFSQNSRPGGNTTLAFPFQREPVQSQTSSSLELTTPRSANQQDVHRNTGTSEARGAIRDHRRRPRPDPYLRSRERRQNNKAYNLVPEEEDDWSPLSDRCSNCNRSDHRVIDCWGPTDAYGYIDRCPCNGLGHYPDQCPIVQTWSNLLTYKVLYVARVGLPQFKHSQSFIFLIIHAPEVRELHETIKFAMRRGCPNDTSLSWRYNPLTKEFCMRTWNHAKPWRYHDYTKPQERWCNLPDPAYIDENWLEKAKAQMILNPLKQSFISRRAEKRDLPGMQASCKDLKHWQQNGETRNLPVLQRNMQEWSTFYITMEDEPTAYMEWIFKKLSRFSDDELNAIRQMGPQNCNTILQAFYKSETGVPLTAKPGIGAPQVPWNKSDMISGLYFRLSRVPAAPVTTATSATAASLSRQNHAQSDFASASDPSTNNNMEIADNYERAQGRRLKAESDSQCVPS